MKKTQKSYNSTLRGKSDKQKDKDAHWNKITDEVCEELDYICQYCGWKGQRYYPDELSYLDGHHIIKRRFNIHTKENCYPVHRKCHAEADKVVVSIGDYKTRELFL